MTAFGHRQPPRHQPRILDKDLDAERVARVHMDPRERFEKVGPRSHRTAQWYEEALCALSRREADALTVLTAWRASEAQRHALRTRPHKRTGAADRAYRRARGRLSPRDREAVRLAERARGAIAGETRPFDDLTQLCRALSRHAGCSVSEIAALLSATGLEQTRRPEHLRRRVSARLERTKSRARPAGRRPETPDHAGAGTSRRKR
jgi:hypothetical protein